jgi:anaerobic selenocysteine-containing dehydrogenase
MYHAWHSQNAWLRQIVSHNRLYINRRTAADLGLADDDWVWVTSHHSKVKCRIRTMEGVNPDTVWTWNAIGKRPGAWNLAADAPEGRHGFLLNHVISDLLPPRQGTARYSNSDPVTGQAAWYDLRVRIERAAPDEAGETAPRLEAVRRPAGLAPPPTILRYGAAQGRRP